jgi:aminopeptidase
VKDIRVDKLSKVLIGHSCSLQAGEKVLIEAIGIPREMILSLIREAKQVGGTAYVNIKDDRVIREQCLLYSKRDIVQMAECELNNLERMDAYIGIRGYENIYEFSDIPQQKMKQILKHYIQPVHLEQRNEHTKWVVTRWPTSSMAQRIGMSTEAFEDFFFNACFIDYMKMREAMIPFSQLMRRTNHVRITGPSDTDISFSIAGMPNSAYTGKHNLPDGELLTAPVRDSIRGRIRYNVPSVFYGSSFENICFDFKKGKISDATCNDNKRLGEILDQDEGARYVGEFAFGLNPYITRPMKDILFDEKMFGSIHLAQGNAYRSCDNGNRSSLHWDLILMQTPEAGGGEIYFDGVLIRKNGRFVIEELEGLNPENLR